MPLKTNGMSKLFPYSKRGKERCGGKGFIDVMMGAKNTIKNPPSPLLSEPKTSYLLM